MHFPLRAPRSSCDDLPLSSLLRFQRAAFQTVFAGLRGNANFKANFPSIASRELSWLPEEEGGVLRDALQDFL